MPGSKPAYTFLQRNDYEGSTITYSDLAARVTQLAGHLQQITSKGGRILLMFPHGPEFITSFYAVVHAGRIAVPADIPRAKGLSERIQGIVDNCGASTVLTLRRMVDQVRGHLIGNIQVLAIEDLESRSVTEYTPPHTKPGDIALIQYTSGSTGQAKGVTITHENLLENQKLIKKAFKVDKDSVIIGWLPFYHDMGLIGNVIQSLYSGAHAVLFSPVDFLLKPKMWLEVISKYKGTVSGAPNFAYQYCIDRVSETDLKTLNLSSWLSAFCGAEMVKHQTLRDFASKFSTAGFRQTSLQPCYGMAETTLLISAAYFNEGPKVMTLPESTLQWEATREDDRTAPVDIVSCGRPLNYDLLLVNAAGESCAENEVGQIWVRGKSVSSGYWNQPNTDFQNFYKKQGPYFDTGDLGFLNSGHLYLTGRKKELIIIRGRNHYPHDIEALVTLQDETLINDRCAAFSISHAAGEKLIIVCETTQKAGFESQKLIDKIQKALSVHLGIAAGDLVFIKKNTLPRTTSGKIQRNKCRDQFIRQELQVVESTPLISTAPSEELSPEESKVRDCLQALVPDKVIHKSESLFSMGFDSLQLVHLAQSLSAAFDKDISLDLLFEEHDIASLTAAISNHTSDFQQGVLTNRAPTFPLTKVQAGVWYDHHIHPSDRYNISALVPMEPAVDGNLLSQRLNQALSHNEILRCTYQAVDGKIVHKVNTKVNYEIKILDCSALDLPEIRALIQEEVQTIFDLSQWPLFKIRVLQLPDNERKLLVVFHHIITDGHSLSFLINALLGHQNHALATTKISYRDYVDWWNQYARSNQYQKDRAYWIGIFKDKQPYELPFHPKSAIKEQNSSLMAALSAEQTRRITRLAHEMSCTPYTVMLGVFLYLMQRLSSQGDAIVGVPANGRTLSSFQHVAGMFINPIMINLADDEATTTLSLIQLTSQKLRIGLKHQKYPLNDLLHTLYTEEEHFKSRYITKVFFNGLDFAGDQASLLFESFQHNPGIESYQDINCYVFLQKDALKIRLDYNPQRVDKIEAERLLFQYQYLLDTLLTSPDKPMAAVVPALPITQTESNQLLAFAQGPKTALPTTSLLAQIREQVLRNPDNTAYQYEKLTTSYKEIWEQSDAMASLLKAKGVGKNDLIPVIMPKSPEFPSAILACLKTGAAHVPFDTDWPIERTQTLLADLEPKAIIVDHEKRLRSISYQCQVLSLEKPISPQPYLSDYAYDPEALMYGIYTSGTTGKPKCTLNKQIGVLNRFADMTARFGGGLGHNILFSSRQSFDVSFWQMFWPLTIGAKVVIPVEQKGFDPVEFIDLISQQNINLVDQVPSVFNLLVESLEQNQGNLPNLKNLQQILIGGEVISAEHVHKFMDMYPDVQIYNTYGPTETAMGTLFHPITRTSPLPIPLGKPMRNVTAAILNEKNELAAIGQTGELCLGGACVGAGYHNLPEKTSTVFIKNPVSRLPTNSLYRTGDMAYYLPSGEIQFAGRRDDQIKLNGIRIELGEVQSLLTSIEGVHRALVTLQKNHGKQELVAYYSGEAGLNQREIKQKLSFKLPQYMVPHQLVKLSEWPLLPTGKLDFSRLPKPTERQVENSYASPQNKQETEFTAIIAKVLAISPKVIGRNDNLFNIGVDSLKATKIQLQVQSELYQHFELRHIFENPSVASLTPLLTPYTRANSPDSAHQNLSKAQHRIWLQSQSIETSIANNLPVLLEVTGNLSIQIIERALQVLVEQHEILRTVFPAIAGSPKAVVLKQKALHLSPQETTLPQGELDSHLRKWVDEPFDLSKGPLLRVQLIKTKDQHNKCYLAFCIHHIITDAWSVDLMMKALAEQFSALSTNRKPREAAPIIQYRDAVSLKAAYALSDQYKADVKYWKERFEAGVPEFSWPTDFARPKKRTYDNAVVHLLLIPAESNSLTAFCQHRSQSKFAFVFTCVNLLLHKYTGQKQVVLGLPVSGRHHATTQNQLGLFINTLVLNTRVDGQMPMEDLLAKVSKDLLDAIDHQQFEYEDLLDLLKPNLEAGRNPLFDISVVMDKMDLYNETMENLSGLTVKRKVFDKKYILSDVNVILRESNDQLKLSIEYNTNLYTAQTIRNFTHHLHQVMLEVMASPGIPAGQVQYLPKPELDLLVYQYNQTGSQYPRDTSVVALFREQVKMHSDQPALLQDETLISYGKLDRITDFHAQRLLVKLQQQRVDQEIIPILSNDPMTTIMAALAVLKAGKGYMPIDPGFPSERIRLMLDQSKARLIITEKNQESLPELGLITMVLDTTDDKTDSRQELSWPDRQPLSLCYVMYTSGSTGQPKGVIGYDRNVVRLVKNNRLLPLTPEDRLLQTSPMTFDPSVLEIWGGLLNGASLQLTGKKIILNPEALKKTLVDYEVTTLWLTTPIFVEMASMDPGLFKTLRQVIVGGDRLPGETGQRFVDACPETQLTNAYGPTENGVFSTCYKVTDPVPEFVPIGKAINNTKVYILDEYLHPVPEGVEGTLYVGGDGLPRGYFDENLTKELFIKSPFDTTERLYETGDLGKWLPDGNIRFSGRKDRQIKINGIRIELGEIETVLNKYPAVRSSLVLFEEGGLLAYLVTEGDKPDTDQVKDYLSRFLIKIMVPEMIFIMDSFPLTQNGKIDIKALPRPKKHITQYPVPEDPHERSIRSTWAGILKMQEQQIGLHHDFFDLGGNSLLLGRVIIRIKENYNIQLSYNDLFENRTIEKVAALVKSHEPSKTEDTGIPVLDRTLYRLED